MVTWDAGPHVHGGWHVPESYGELTAALQSAGYDVHVPRMPSTNPVRPPDADLSSDTALIRSYVESLVQDGRTVVALMHSYGGQVGTNALHGLGVAARSARGLPGGVSRLVYMTAYAVAEGTAMMDKVKEFGHIDLVPVAFDFAEDGSCVSSDPKTLVVGPGRDEAETEAYLNTLVRWNGKCMYQPLEHCAWREIPVAYIYTTADMTVPLDYQKNFVEGMEKAGVKVQTYELATGHCPNFTATEAVVAVVDKVVSEEENRQS
ncbi:alpha/beta-hydrolase [Durotheca rogersii]|uniref:alpha/beta-hydrolase n=1 Tax=Durotheca rogersii TaxID=419775 RepID=UPI00221E3E53|nr:alpha/beta-hydrolase [Durotheca rogersii]KAI5863660.1 alpha/beta-hydrolase [Durotheca rogersii]